MTHPKVYGFIFMWKIYSVSAVSVLSKIKMLEKLRNLKYQNMKRICWTIFILLTLLGIYGLIWWVIIHTNSVLFGIMLHIVYTFISFTWVKCAQEMMFKPKDPNFISVLRYSRFLIGYFRHFLYFVCLGLNISIFSF